MKKPIRQTFIAQVRVRWWFVTVLSLVSIVALYAVLQASSISLLDGVKYGYQAITASIWISRIWFGVGILAGAVISKLYITNSDTEVWVMGKIELTRRISKYEAELEKRDRDDEWRDTKWISKEEAAERASRTSQAQKEKTKRATDVT